MNDTIAIERNEYGAPLRADRRRRARRLRGVPHEPGTHHLHAHVVRPEHEGQGLGTRLAKFVLDDAVARGDADRAAGARSSPRTCGEHGGYEASVDWP